MLIAGMCR